LTTFTTKTVGYTAAASDAGAIHRCTSAITVALTAASTLASNWSLTIVADGADVTIDPNASETIDGRTTLTVRNGSAVTIYCDGSNFRTDLGADQRVPKGSLYGLTISNNSVDATNDIDIAAGEAASEGTVPYLMILSSSLTKRLDAAWAVGSGNGGLDTGSIANTTYHVWLIQRSDTGVVDALFSTSATSPTMPTSYDRKRRIGAIIREGGIIVPFSQNGDEFLILGVTLDVDVQNPGTSGTLRTLRVPTGVKVMSLAQYSAVNLGSAVQAGYYVTSPDQSDQVAVTQGGAPLIDHGHVSLLAGQQTPSVVRLAIRTNTSGQVRTRNISSTTDVFINISTQGWIDSRGRT